MRRWLIALATALVAGALWVGAAYADAGPHGNYNYNPTTQAYVGQTTYRCASCHRAHTALSDGLVKDANQYLLCTSCHGTGSDLDAIDGLEYDAGAVVGSTRGSGFINTTMNTSMSTAAPTQRAATSVHRVAGLPVAGGTSTGLNTAWGMGDLGVATGAGTQITLACGTCHDPHGGSGGVDPATGNRIPTYRILRADIARVLPGAPAGAKVTVPEQASPKDYKVSPVTLPNSANWPLVGGVQQVAPGAYYGQLYDATTMKALDNWCAICHSRIHTSDATSSPGSVSSGDSIFKFRHATTGTSVEINLGTSQGWPSGSPGCVSCHVSHGSSATNMGRTSPLKVVVPGGDATVGPYLDSSLLRVDNRGVCELCHNK